MTHTVVTRWELAMAETRMQWTHVTLGTLLVWFLSLGALANPSPAAADNEIFVAGSNAVVVFPQTANGNVAPIRRLPALGGAGGVLVDSINHEVYVTDFSNHAIHVYARTADGIGVAPVRTISGVATQLKSPFGMFVDTVHDELIVADSGDDKVLIFPRTANGNVAPIRRLKNGTLDDTGFFGPLSVFVDLVHDELFVSVTKLHTDAILVFSRTANSDTAVPIRQFATGFNSFPEGLFVNPATDEIIAAHTMIDGEIRAYPRTANAPIVGSTPPAFPPTRSIAGAATGLRKPAGLGVDLVNGEIIVSNLSLADPNDPSPASVRVFPLSGSGNIAPLRVIKGAATGLSSVQLMALGSVPVLPAVVVASVLPVSRSVKGGGDGDRVCDDDQHQRDAAHQLRDRRAERAADDAARLLLPDHRSGDERPHGITVRARHHWPQQLSDLRLRVHARLYVRPDRGQARLSVRGLRARPRRRGTRYDPAVCLHVRRARSHRACGHDGRQRDRRRRGHRLRPARRVRPARARSRWRPPTWARERRLRSRLIRAARCFLSR